MPICVLLADSGWERRASLRAALLSDPELLLVGEARDGQEALQMAATLRPEIALLADDLAGWDGFETAERLAASGLLLESVLVTSNGLHSDFSGSLRRAMRAGARECVVWPGSAADLCASLRQVSDDRRRRSASEQDTGEPRGKILAVTGAKGGVGKTTLAVNLAAALARTTGEPTVLLDLQTQCADAALLLNIAPRRTLAELSAVPAADLDAGLLQEYLTRHECGLHLLAGAGPPLPPGALTPALLNRLLAAARSAFRYVVLDVPALLTETNRAALSQATTAFLVANLFDLPTLAGSRLWLEAVAGRTLPREAVQIVLSRVSPRNPLPLAEVERALGGPFHAIVNEGRLVPASVNAGVPFVLSHPGSRIGQSVYALARQVSAESLPSAEAIVPARPVFLPALRWRGGRA